MTVVPNGNANYRTMHGAPPLPNHRSNARGLNSERGVVHNQSLQGGGSYRPQECYQSTSIEQNVMMFDSTSQAEALAMSSAFDHIQEELAKLGDQLT